MTTGKINYSPDYKSPKRYPDPRKVFEGMEWRAEHQRLKDAVVERAKEWQFSRLDQIGDKVAHSEHLSQAITVLLAFEQKQKRDQP